MRERLPWLFGKGIISPSILSILLWLLQLFPPFWRNFVGSTNGKNASHHIIQNGGTISNGDIMSDVEHTTEVVDDQETDQVLQQVKFKKQKQKKI